MTHTIGYQMHLVRINIAVGTLVFLFLSMLSLRVEAQQVSYFIESDTTFYPIGTAIVLKQTWKYPGNEPVEAPGVPKRLGKLELLTQGEAEVHTDEDMNQGTRLSTFICFDTGYFHLPGLSWKVGRDSVISNPLVLEVAMLPVDTTLDFKDIDPPMQVPYTLRELIPYIGGALAVLLAIAGLVLLVRRKKRRVNPQASIDLRPAHIKALEQLELLEKEKPWQSGEEKEYHARLSAIFREYVAARFGRDTLDLTTGEFLSLCSGLGFSAQAITSLGHYLSLGDLVKFAKARATPLEHTESLEAVRQAVAQTALDPLPITQPNG